MKRLLYWKNAIIYWAVVGSVIVFGSVGIVLLLVFGRTKVNSNNPPAPEKVPTMELAQSVCEEHDGEFKLGEASNGTCLSYAKQPKFYFVVEFVKDEDKEEMLAYLNSMDSYNYKTLEKNDDYYKIYTNSSNSYVVYVLYKNAMITIVAFDVEFIDGLVAELGFPDNNKIGENMLASDEDDYKAIADVITPRAAETLCEKYDGKIVDKENVRFGTLLNITADFLDSRICERYTYREVDPSVYRGHSFHADGTPLSDEEIQEMYGMTIGSKDFSYAIGFLKEDKKSEYWDYLRNMVANSEAHEDVSKYVILEDSKDMFKACNSTAGLMLTCFGMYDNIVIGISSGKDFPTVDKLFANLGFPNRATLEEYASAKRAESNK